MKCFIFLSVVAVAGCSGSPSAPVRAEVGAETTRRIVALGRLEPADGIVSISALPGEAVKSFGDNVSEGATVDGGAELAKLASLDLREKQLASVDARLTLAKLQRVHESAVAAALLELALAAKSQAVAKLKEALSGRMRLDNLAEASAIGAEDYRRLSQLQQSDAGLVTEHQLRRRFNQSDRATKEYEAAEASYGPTIDAANKGVAAAAANVKLARQNVEFAEKVDQVTAVEMERRVAEEVKDQSVLYAPGSAGDGVKYTVLKLFMRPGEVVTQLPVLQVGDLSRMACAAEVYEADAKELVLHQQAQIRSSAFSGPLAEQGLAGKVVRIGKLISSPGLSNRNPLAPSDRSVVEVRIEIDAQDAAAMAQARNLIGLQATVEFGAKPGEEEKSKSE